MIQETNLISVERLGICSFCEKEQAVTTIVNKLGRTHSICKSCQIKFNAIAECFGV